MASFKDINDKTWELRLVIAHLAKLRAVGFDLDQYTADGAGLFMLLALPPETLGSVLWVLCEKQADAAGVTADDFAERFDGNVIDAAGLALVDAVIDFFPFPGSAPGKVKLKDAARKSWAEAGSRAVEEIDRLMKGLGSNDSAGNSPAKSESIPAS